MKKPKVSKWYLFRSHLAGIQAHGGKFYVSNCWPWQIKQGCPRLDCPMRTLAIPPEARPDDYLMECDPIGVLADLLQTLRSTKLHG